MTMGDICFDYWIPRGVGAQVQCPMAELMHEIGLEEVVSGVAPIIEGGIYETRSEKD